MKKTLALLLALLMIATMALAACQKDKKPSGLDDLDDEYNNLSDTDFETEENESTSGSDTKKPVSNEWVDKNDVVYAGASNLNLRTSASASSSNNISKKVDSGTKLNRISTNGIWSKVTLEGNTQEYYVSNDWISSNASDFEITPCTAVALTINETTNNILFFESPFESYDGADLRYENVALASGFKKANVKGEYSLQKIGTSASGNWVKVKFVGTIEISSSNTKTFTADNPGEFFVKIRAFNRGDITDPTYTGGNTPSGGGIG